MNTNLIGRTCNIRLDNIKETSHVWAWRKAHENTNFTIHALRQNDKGTIVFLVSDELGNLYNLDSYDICLRTSGVGSAVYKQS